MKQTDMSGRWRRVLPLLLALLLALAACGAGSAGSDTAAADTVGAGSEEAMHSENGSDAGYGVLTEDADYEMETAESAPMDDNEVPSSGDVNQQDAGMKLIYTANLEMEALDFDAATAGLKALVEECGGYFESSNLYDYSASYGSYGGGRSANYTIRVPSEQYRPFLEAVSVTENCHVLRLGEDMQDIGTEYFDVETRLATLRTKMERLQELLSQATEMESIIAIESAISDTEYEIELYTSTLNRYDSLVDYATVNLYLEEVIDLTEEEEITFLARLTQGFRVGAKRFVEGVQDLAVWAAYHFLHLIVIALLAAALILLIRRGRRRKAERLAGRPDAKNLKSKNTSQDTGSAGK